MINVPLFAMLLFVVLLCAFCALLLARGVARKVGLVDRPNHRKHHHGVIPLVGGLSVFSGISSLLLFSVPLPGFFAYLSGMSILMLVGMLDDRFEVSVAWRVAAQAVAAMIMMIPGGLTLQHLGYILGPDWDIELGWLNYPITVCVVWAAINAFNMIDGIDGLLGGLSCVSFMALGVLFYHHGDSALVLWSMAMIAALLPYCGLNLGIFGRRYKVFMGDAGSTMVGFSVIWLLLQGSQGENASLRPVTALWVMAIPLMDLVAIIYRRLRRGHSLFLADRQHIHHLLMRAGWSSRQACGLITLCAALLAAAGISAELLAIPEYLMLAAFLLVFGCYGYGIKGSWRLARIRRRMQRHASRQPLA
ncbi:MULTISPECIES: UDP-N-acetylglucosamine--undecaprenyl-phosphate N-acetylglucosaminephosphotransferase [unclassified Dickeya]|uniref:UDP-N-acetylglucosamine--undecaprenyl-phosphate N-acetylglucosaminephosphotransferase n=1 Tax=Dickeya sp. DW 0440 TaxID=1225785 RepID=UPI0003AABEDE|nr:MULTISPECIES: UDP-N-acetylglucosamine--undecaprenyl-phosphate N-acetylglucosaminephosphotransferase [unclassified Dickeya]